MVLAASVFGVAGRAQTENETKDQPVTIGLLVEMLQIGLDERQLIAYLDRRGWPQGVEENDLLVTRRAGAGSELQGRLYRLLTRRSEPERLARLFDRLDGDLNGNRRYSILVPKGFEVRTSGSGNRITVHENDVQGWFRGTRYFVWFEERRAFEAKNTDAVARIAAEAALDRLARSGVSVGRIEEDRLQDRRGAGERPYFHALCREVETDTRGFMALTAQIDAESGILVICGFTAPVVESGTAVEIGRERLADMMSNMRLVRQSK